MARTSGSASTPRARPQKTLDQFSAGADGPSVAGPERDDLSHLPAGTLLEKVAGPFIEHPWLEPREIRAHPFQVAIARSALEDDVLVVLPTGLGKTVIGALVAAEILRSHAGKVLMLSPTRPLVQQHAKSFKRWFRDLRQATFTGAMSSPVREGTWDDADAVFATPQLVVNDLQNGAYSMKDVGLLILDEAHRAVGAYAYVKIVSIYRTQRAERRRVLGLTASPGGQGARIDEILGNLGVNRVEARSPEDPDVVGYLKAITTDTVSVALAPEVEALRTPLKQDHHKALVALQRMGFLRQKPLAFTGVKDLVATRGAIMARPGGMGRKFGALYHLMLAMHLQHALELLETQGVSPFLDYIGRVETKEKLGKADKAFLALPSVVKARTEGTKLLATGAPASHPKLEELQRLVDEALRTNPQAKILVFAQFRDTIRSIVEVLRGKEIDARRFVGQATRSDEDPGMNQKEQVRSIDDFRQGRFPVLVASSVAEEGLDIPDVDLVVFFEALPSEVRTIQRRGRTGRSSAGRVVVLMAEGTRDEGYHRAERKRESAMRRHVRRLSKARPARPSTPPSVSQTTREGGHPPDGSTS